MRLEDMRYFVEIVNARSINQASKTLFVAQPALSRAIAALEKELGFPLLKRSKHGITPTKEGMIVYKDCISLLQLYSDCTRKWQDIAYAATETISQIRIAALPMICNNTMNDVFCEIAHKYPRIQLTLFERQLQDVLNEVTTYPKTICISHYNDQTKNEIYEFARTNRLQVIPLFDDCYQFFVSCDSPLVNQKLTTADLKNCTLASYSQTIETAALPQFIAAGLINYDKLFRKVIYLSNRYTIMDLTVANKALSLTGNIISSQEAYRKNNSVLPLQVTDFHLPMTYFILMAAEPSVEESIVANLLHDHYMALAEKL